MRACDAEVNIFPRAATIRLLLGIFEASVTPGFALITSQVRIPVTHQTFSR